MPTLRLLQSNALTPARPGRLVNRITTTDTTRMAPTMVARTFLDYLKQAPKHMSDLPCHHAAQGECPLLPAKPAKRRATLLKPD